MPRSVSWRLTHGINPKYPVVKKLYSPVAERFILKYEDDDDNEHIVDFDFRTAVNETPSADPSNPSLLLAANISIDDENCFINFYRKSSEKDVVSQQKYSGTYPHYIFLDDGETATEETVPNDSVPSWIKTSLTYAEKQRVAMAAILSWRAKKREWMIQAAERADLAANLVDKVGKWLSAADAALKNDFQNSSVDPLTVAALATEAAKGALDITDVDTFMQGVHFNSTTPSNAILWVSKGNNPPDTVARVNFSSIVDYGANTLSSNYNPIDSTWIVENQVGSISLDDTTPTVGDSITATLTDPDGGISGTTWQWQKQSGGNWSDISNSVASTYTTVAVDVGSALRVKATYTDNYGSNNIVFSESTSAVGA